METIECDRHGTQDAYMIEGIPECSVCIDGVTDNANVCIACEG